MSRNWVEWRSERDRCRPLTSGLNESDPSLRSVTTSIEIQKKKVARAEPPRATFCQVSYLYCPAPAAFTSSGLKACAIRPKYNR
jgi:hypothetical protein